MNKFNITVCLLLGFCFSAKAELFLFNPQTKKYRTIETIEIRGVTVSKDCLKKSKTPCLALQALDKKMKEELSATGVLGNPAARYCMTQKATNKLLLDKKKREFDYCVFSDNSMIDAWSLYKYHFGV